MSPIRLAVHGAVGGGASFPDAIIATPDLGDVRVPVFADGQMWGPPLPEFSPDRPGITDKGIFASYLSGDFLFELIVDAAKDRGLAKILAEPNLTTLSGQQAKFLAGGEFPVPVPADFGSIGIEYKEFGVGLQFIPVVLDSGVINLKLNVTVSELQPSNSLTLDLGNLETANRLMDMLQNDYRFGYMAVSLGYFDTLMSCSGSTTSSEMTEEDKRKAGISPGLVRMSLGITGTVEQRWRQLELSLVRLGVIDPAREKQAS